MKEFDYVIIGGGCAGLSLAYELEISNKLKDKTLAIIELREEYKRDKTWSFWKVFDHSFEDCVIKSWNNFTINTSEGSQELKNDKYPYQSINSGKFYEKINLKLSSNPNVNFFENLDEIKSENSLIFNSVIKDELDKSELWQHFQGLEIETPKVDKIKQLELRKDELLRYVKETMKEIQQKISENDRKIRDCEECFEEIKLKVDFESKIQKVEEAVEDTLRKIQEMTSQIASLKEKQILASKLQLKDNKCPVCDSIVEKLNPFFQEEHIKDEIIKLQQEIKLKEKERDMYTQKRREFEEKVQKTRNAESTLRAHSINTKKELLGIKKETEIQKEKYQSWKWSLCQCFPIW